MWSGICLLGGGVGGVHPSNLLGHEDGEEHSQPDGGDEDDNRDEVDCQVAVGEEESSELVQE